MGEMAAGADAIAAELRREAKGRTAARVAHLDEVDVSDDFLAGNSDGAVLARNDAAYAVRRVERAAYAELEAEVAAHGAESDLSTILWARWFGVKTALDAMRAYRG
jgi:hypothetical protein